MNSIRSLSLIFLALLLSACNFTLAADVTPPPGYQPMPAQPTSAEEGLGPLYPLVPPDPSNGEQIYAEKCAPCHGATGLGDGPQAAQLPNPVAALASPELTRKSLPTEWFRIVSEGNLERYMPPFQSLTSRQRWDVIAFALTMGVSSATIDQGAEIYSSKCAECHGEGGKGDGPRLSGTSAPDFTNQEWMAGKSAQELYDAINTGVSSAMPGFGDQISEDEGWAVTSYLRSLTFAISFSQPVVTEQPVSTTPATQTIVTSEPAITVTGEISPTLDITSTQGMTETVLLGSVTGIVTNESGGIVPSDLELTLNAFDHSEIVFTTTRIIGADGTFEFDDVELIEGLFYLITVEYDGISYASTIGMVEAGIQTLDLPVQIFDTTTDMSSAVVDRLHLFLEFLDEKTVRVVELYVVTNATNKTLIAPTEGHPVLTFTLPQGAANLEFQDGSLGDRYTLFEGGFGDTTPIYPGAGDYQVLFSYELPYNRKLDLVRPAQLATNAVIILVPEDGLKIKGSTIQDAGTRDVQGTLYHMYSGNSLSAGSELQLTITGKPGGSVSLAGESNVSLLLGLGVLGVVLVITGIWFYRRNAQPDDREEEDSRFDQKDDSAESVMDAILALDDMYQAGELPEDAYLQRRSALKDRLKSLIG